MEIANYSSRLCSFLNDRGCWSSRPFTLLDVGCSGGIDPIWRLFEPNLRSFGIDPQKNEIDRLSIAEHNPNVRYFPFFVGVDAGHPFKDQEALDRAATPRYFDTWWRSSAARAAEVAPSGSVQSNSLNDSLVPSRISVDGFVERYIRTDVDFLKVDTDGADLEALVSAERLLATGRLLGVLIESNFTGGYLPTCNAWHNVDRLLKSHGYMLYNFSFSRYSRAELPARFKYQIFAQTESGVPIQGDFLYLKDAASDDFPRIDELVADERQLLLLAALYDLFSVPDCAAELLQKRRDRIISVDVDSILDLLVPRSWVGGASYSEYVERFERDPTTFFPRS